jgi:hypothetical protein
MPWVSILPTFQLSEMPGMSPRTPAGELLERHRLTARLLLPLDPDHHWNADD